jgi:hypothetical protein
MKTTFDIDETLVAELEREAARKGRTTSELVETALRRSLPPERPSPIPELPSFHGGGTLIDIENRDALFRA